MKRRHSFAILLLFIGAACQPTRVTPPPAAIAQPQMPAPEQPVQPTKEEIAARIARKKKAEAARLAKIRKQAADALERGRERLREEQNAAAMEAFQEAVQLDRDSVDAWLRIAYVYEQEGDVVKAAEAFREVKKLWAL